MINFCGWNTVQQEIQPIAMHAGLLMHHIKLAVLIQHSSTVVFETGSQDFRGHEQSRVHKAATELLANARLMHKRGDTVDTAD